MNVPYSHGCAIPLLLVNWVTKPKLFAVPSPFWGRMAGMQKQTSSVHDADRTKFRRASRPRSKRPTQRFIFAATDAVRRVGIALAMLAVMEFSKPAMTIGL